MKYLIAALLIVTMASQGAAQEVKVPPNPQKAVYKTAEYRKISFFRVGVRRHNFLGIPIYSPVVRKQDEFWRVKGPSLHLYYR